MSGLDRRLSRCGAGYRSARRRHRRSGPSRTVSCRCAPFRLSSAVCPSRLEALRPHCTGPDLLALTCGGLRSFGLPGEAQAPIQGDLLVCLRDAVRPSDRPLRYAGNIPLHSVTSDKNDKMTTVSYTRIRIYVYVRALLYVYKFIYSIRDSCHTCHNRQIETQKPL